MSVDRIKFQNIVESQLPDYVVDDFPLLGDFLRQYYISQEFESGTYDLVNNLDQYVKIEELTKLTTSTVLGADLGYTDTSIITDQTGNFTEGFANTDGLIMIDNEIIYYEQRTETGFEGCRRGFSGTTSYEGSNTPDELVFTRTIADLHKKGATIKNLNVLFLQIFLSKLKAQITPGFDERTLFPELDQENFIINSDSFYKSKGTPQAFDILFRALYGVGVEIIRPSEFLLTPSNANYKVTRDIVVEKFFGDPMNLLNRTLFQDSTGARGSVSNVRPVVYNNKTFYQVSLDLGYQRDINVDGTILGSFTPAPKTQVLDQVAIGSTIINVDSTIGFPNSGFLMTTDIDGENVNLAYSGKNDNQIFNVEPTLNTIPRGTQLTVADLAYAYVGILTTTEKIEVKISSAMKDITFEDNNHSLRAGEKIEFQSIGIQRNDEKSKNYDLNVKTGWKVENLTLLDPNANSYRVKINNPSILHLGYKIVFRDPDLNDISGEVASIQSSTEFTVNTTSSLDLAISYSIENQLLFTDSTTYPYLKNFVTNVQNTYTKILSDDTLVASNSLPSFPKILINPYGRSLNFSGSAVDDTIELVSNGDHGFLTGDAVYYTPNVGIVTTTDIDGNIIEFPTLSTFEDVSEGVYYVERVSNLRIKIAKSRSNLFSGLFIPLVGSVTDVNFTYYPFYDKSFEPQALYRQISLPINKSGKFTTTGGHIGILNNGVEILNYKSPSKISYGPLVGFSIVNEGKGYDIINPPLVHINDEVGVGATGTASIIGGLERIEILDTGFDYVERPIVSISGGNGKGATAEARLSSVPHSVEFNAADAISLGLAGPSGLSSSIGFSTFHKFRDCEEVIYQSLGEKGVPGLSTGASYYVGVIDSKRVRLYETFDDSANDINHIPITELGEGIQAFKSANLKDIVTSIVVTDSGRDYENNERKIVGVNTALNRILIDNHGYESKEIVHYTGTDIEGLVTSQRYYVVKIDDNSFSLTDIGVGNTLTDFYYDNNILVDINSKGSGSFNYMPIVVTVDGVTGVSTRAGQDFNCVVQPVFRGQVKSLDLTEGGVGYGSSEIIDFDRKPVVTLNSGSDCQLTPIINNGQIVDVLVDNPGNGYNSPPDLVIITTTGRNAVLTPVLKDGKIESVTIIKAGAGYVAKETAITVIPAGREVVVDAIVNQWNINLFESGYNNIKDDDGFLANNINDTQLEYSYMYAPRPLRENTFAISGTAEDNTVYGVPDLVIENGVEQTSVFHSPIIGWAYDGNPIYGPYGFDQPGGSSFVRRMVPGYKLRQTFSGRPSISDYPVGFFIEDYIFAGDGDLDEHNGRFCVTPDYPNGVYAYFATINSVNDSTGPFDGYRRPIFPYLIGDSYHSVPDQFNFKLSSNQNDYDPQGDNWLRNTFYYNLNDIPSGYDYIFNPNNVKQQELEITAASVGGIESVGILTGGLNYKIGDEVIFDNTETGGGRGARANVSSLEGKPVVSVSAASTILYDVEFTPVNQGAFVGFADTIHNFKSGQIINISGLSSYIAGFGGFYQVGVRTDNFILNLGISSASANEVEFLNVEGVLESPFIRSNDILSLGQEQVRVLNIEKSQKRIRVQRAVNGTVGVAHSNGTILFENPKKFTIQVGGLSTTRTFPINDTLYINPSEQIGVGTVRGAGAGTTVTISNPGVGQSEIFIPVQNIYAPGHGFELNEPLVYSPNGGSAIAVWDGLPTDPAFPLDSYSGLFAVPLSANTFGIAPNKVGLGSTGFYVGVGNTNIGLLYFVNAGVGNTHRFTTNRNNVFTAEVSKNTVTVAVSTAHGMNNDDVVRVDVKPTTEKVVTVQYNDFNRRMVFDPQSFTAGDVDVTNNSIEFSGEFFRIGDKVIHTSSSPSGGLVNNGMYFVVPFNDKKVRLVTEKYQIAQESPDFVDITSASSGTLSRINPQTQVEKNQRLKFDLSDTSLSFIRSGARFPAFEMNLYTDAGYTNVFFTTGQSNEFDVTKTGQPGTAGANLTLNVTDRVPSVLYYKFDTDFLDLIPTVKSELVIDEEVFAFNNIQTIQSVYSGAQVISDVSTLTFGYTIADVPEVSSYDETTANLNYTTNSKSALGSISKITVTEGGAGYKILPGITSIRSGLGSDAIISVNSNSIGKILSTRYEDIGFNYPSDQTVKVIANVPEVLEVESLMSFSNIGVTSAGTNYLNSPKLVVIDGFTGEVVENVDIRYNVRDTKVEILQNTNGLFDVTPTILPTNNSNGVGISSIDYNSSTKRVRVYLNAQFSRPTDFRYTVGQPVMIEGVSIGIGSTGTGYNSEDYNYKLFEVVEFDSQLGGSGAYFDYSLADVLGNGEEPGTFDASTSVARAIPKTDFPIFDITLEPNSYFTNEKVVSGNNTGVIERWTPSNRRLVISSGDEFEIGSQIEGESSGTIGVVKSRSNFKSTVSTGAGTTFINGWNTNSGFLNDSLQRLPNNEYYQNLSYSIKSTIPLDTWDDAVSSLSHIAGLAKFADLSVEATDDVANSLEVKPAQSAVEVVIDIISESSISCWHDFDNVSENLLIVDGVPTSNKIIFQNKILTDYNESIGNRVLSIDDFSDEFNSNERPSKEATVGSGIGVNRTYNKYLTYAKNIVQDDQRQISIVSSLHGDPSERALVSEYGILDTKFLGSYDVEPNGAGTEWRLIFNPVDFAFDSYDMSYLTFSVLDDVTSVGSTSLGDIVTINSSHAEVAANANTTVLSIPNTVRSAKLLVQIHDSLNRFAVDELNLLHDGTNVELLEYGSMESDVGFGTFVATVNGSNIDVNLVSNVGVAVSVDAAIINTATTGTGIGTIHLNVSKLDSTYTSISASGSPTANPIYTYTGEVESAYHIVTVTDTTNNEYETFEVISLESISDAPSQFVEYANIQTAGSLGQVGVTTASGRLQLTYTPNSSIAVETRVFSIAMEIDSLSGRPTEVDLNNLIIGCDSGEYVGTLLDRRTEFGLQHQGQDIFQRGFDGGSPTVVSVPNNTVTIPNHFFVSGERVTYTNPGAGTSSAIGIATALISGIGFTDKLPSEVFIVAPNVKEVQFASSAANALKPIPEVLDITSIGVGAGHSITSTKQNQKVLVAIDNVIQSPVVSFGVTTTLTQGIIFNQTFTLAGVTSIFAGDDLRIGGVGGEIVTVTGVGAGTTTSITCVRGRMGTTRTSHVSGSLVEKLSGEYNIVGNNINFSSPPKGNEPVAVGATIDPDGVSWVGLTTSSTFQGRSFMRNGVPGSTDETYTKNYIFDNFSYDFTGIRSEFTLKVDGSNVTGVSTMNPFVLINSVVQEPPGAQPVTVQIPDYEMSEQSGITSITFTGNGADPTGYDPNTGAYPIGGLIISVGSSEGSGYQSLVSAGGTAIISGSGTVTSISIGNSGSGYRSGIQTVNVGVQTASTEIPNIHIVGVATISDGHVVGVAITNPGSGYSQANPPEVVFDFPLSYSDIPLEYVSGSTGSGQGATVNITVGAGGSVVNFAIQDYGFGYGNDQQLTIAAGGTTGIPTDPSLPFSDFRVLIDEVFDDRFNSWSVGDIEVLDSIQDEFDGIKNNFQLTLNDVPFVVATKPGSLVDVDQTLMVFINDILQQPGVSYKFSSGSIIRFTEAPRVGDTSKILFYKGTDGVDLRFVDIYETVKTGDELDIDNNPQLGQGIGLDEDPRTVTNIITVDTVATNPYQGPGLADDQNVLRPVTWCKQLVDKIINGEVVGKDRPEYEPEIYPASYLIKNVGTADTVGYFSNIEPLFNAENEAFIRLFQNRVTLTSQDTLVDASATAVVSSGGTVSSINITNAGIGYTLAPEVSISNPVGLGTTQRATATATISGGSISTITVTNPGTGYTTSTPPLVLIETPNNTVENIPVETYTGDYGVIVGFSTLQLGPLDKFVFSLFIPQDSAMRDTSLVGTGVTLSQLQIGDYLTIYDTNITVGGEFETKSTTGNVIGVAKTFADAVYQVESVSSQSLNVPGVGTTTVTQIITNVGSYTGPISFGSTVSGQYSWGKIEFDSRSGIETFNAYTLNGYTGLSTSALLNRVAPLRSDDYV